MKRLLTMFAVLCLLAGFAFAQGTVTAPPNVFIGVGGGYNATGYTPSGQKAALLVNLGIQAPGTNFYSVTTLIQTPRSSGLASIRTGIGYAVKSSGNLSLIILADAGATVTNTASLGNAGGGLLVHYDLGGLFKNLVGANMSANAGVRMANVAGTAVSPEYMFSIAHRF